MTVRKTKTPSYICDKAEITSDDLFAAQLLRIFLDTGGGSLGSRQLADKLEAVRDLYRYGNTPEAILVYITRHCEGCRTCRNQYDMNEPAAQLLYKILEREKESGDE